MGEIAKRVEFAGVSVFIFVYVAVLLWAIHTGVEQFLSLVFYSIVTILPLLAIIIMINSFDIQIAAIDDQVAASTIMAVVIILVIVAVPQFGGAIRAWLAVLTPAPTATDFLTTLLFVALAESLFKFVIVRGLMEAVKDTRFEKYLNFFVISIMAAIAFGSLHYFRYHSIGAVIYVSCIGVVLLMFGRLPKLLGSSVELSIYPVVFAHLAHNLAIPAASVLMIGGGLTLTPAMFALTIPMMAICLIKVKTRTAYMVVK